jgi:hypothetical protein
MFWHYIYSRLALAGQLFIYCQATAEIKKGGWNTHTLIGFFIAIITRFQSYILGALSRVLHQLDREVAPHINRACLRGFHFE